MCHALPLAEGARAGLADAEVGGRRGLGALGHEDDLYALQAVAEAGGAGADAVLGPAHPSHVLGVDAVVHGGATTLNVADFTPE